MIKNKIVLLNEIVDSAKITNYILIENFGLATYIIILDNNTAVYVNSNTQLYNKIKDNIIGKTLHTDITKNGKKYVVID